MLTHNDDCPKCGMKPNINQNKWKICYTESSGSFCSWEDKTVEEHLDITCPCCGYETCIPCDDYEKQKNNKWTTTDKEEPSKPPTYNRPVMTGHAAPETDAWDTSFCDDCPVE